MFVSYGVFQVSFSVNAVWCSRRRFFACLNMLYILMNGMIGPIFNSQLLYSTLNIFIQPFGLLSRDLAFW